MYSRNITQNLAAAVGDSPVVIVIGARQVGKSTIAQSLRTSDYQPQYLTFDDPTVLSAAQNNPSAFLAGLKTPVIFDEIQRVPELFLPIKAAVDRNRQPGSFLLTGSANVLTLPKVADSLAGRIELLTLRPLSMGELEGRKENFIDAVCHDDFKLPTFDARESSREELFGLMLTGGFPEAVIRKTEARRSAWFKSYVATLLQRDVRDLANIEGLRDLPRLLSILAARAGGLLNYAEISRSAGVPQTTLKRYTALLEAIFLIEPLPAWSGSLTKRLMKTPKLFFTDTGLLGSLQGLTWPRPQLEPTLSGAIAENFVVGELRKQTGWSATTVNLFHFRTQSDVEVDIVIETAAGETIGIEVKAGASVNQDQFKGLRVLESELGKKFKRGIVLYAGGQSVAFGERMFALPLQSLWLM